MVFGIRKLCSICLNKVFRRKRCKYCFLKICKECSIKIESTDPNSQKHATVCSLCYKKHGWKNLEDLTQEFSASTTSENLSTKKLLEKEITESALDRKVYLEKRTSQNNSFPIIPQHSTHSPIIKPLAEPLSSDSELSYTSNTKHSKISTTIPLPPAASEVIPEKSKPTKKKILPALNPLKLLKSSKSSKKVSRSSSQSSNISSPSSKIKLPLSESKTSNNQETPQKEELKTAKLPSFSDTIPLSFNGVRNVLYGYLSLTIHSASNVPAFDSFLVGGKTDPYILTTIESPNSPNKTVRTKTIKRCLEPVWEEKFQIPIFDFQTQKTLKFFLMDEDLLRKDDKIGNFSLNLKTIPFNKLVENKVLEICYNKEESKNNKNPKTTLKVSYKLNINYGNALLSNLIPQNKEEIEEKEAFDTFLISDRVNYLLHTFEPVFRLASNLSFLLNWKDSLKSFCLLFFIIIILIFKKTVSVILLLGLIGKMLYKLFQKYIKIKVLVNLEKRISPKSKLLKNLFKGPFTVFRKSKKGKEKGDSFSLLNTFKPLVKLVTIPTTVITGVKDPLHNLQLQLKTVVEIVKKVIDIFNFEDDLSPMGLLGIVVVLGFVLFGKFLRLVDFLIVIICIMKSKVFEKFVGLVKGSSGLLMMHLNQIRQREGN